MFYSLKLPQHFANYGCPLLCKASISCNQNNYKYWDRCRHGDTFLGIDDWITGTKVYYRKKSTPYGHPLEAAVATMMKPKAAHSTTSPNLMTYFGTSGNTHGSKKARARIKWKGPNSGPTWCHYSINPQWDSWEKLLWQHHIHCCKMMLQPGDCLSSLWNKEWMPSSSSVALIELDAVTTTPLIADVIITTHHWSVIMWIFGEFGGMVAVTYTLLTLLLPPLLLAYADIVAACPCPWHCQLIVTDEYFAFMHTGYCCYCIHFFF